MKSKTGKEMRNLMVAVSVTTLLLVLAVITYFMIDVIVTTNGNIDENKQKVIDQSAQSLTEISRQHQRHVNEPFHPAALQPGSRQRRHRQPGLGPYL